MNIHFYKLRIFHKVILIFLIVIIPVYSIALYINLLSMDIIKRETSNTMVTKVHLFTKSFGEEIGRIKLQQWQLLNKQDLLKLSVYSKTMEFYDTIQLIDNIKESLITISNSSNYIVEKGVSLLLFFLQGK
ncbi:MAG TPA: hypothetical protein VIK78_09445 [Ruminiclostridium sp.]